MEPLSSATLESSESSVGIACGFFDFGSGLSSLLLNLLPDCIIARSNHSSLFSTHAIFKMLHEEALRTSQQPSLLMARLTDLLFMYGLRAFDAQSATSATAPCFWLLLRHTQLAPLAAAIIEAPDKRWTTHSMAQYVHMSRARFCKIFKDVTGQPPAQFLALVRMKLAANFLSSGKHAQEIAQQVGYQSESAFAQAFKRVVGVQPGAWSRAHSAQSGTT
jgi:AraC-like DNA-binding protein